VKFSESSLQQGENEDHEVRWTDELTNELHKLVRRHFRKGRVLVRGIDAVWAVDLINMRHNAKDNNLFLQ
jgi:hypothetical protein